MNEFNIGDLIVLEIALQKFLSGLDLSLEAGKHCTQIIGKIENQIQRVTATAMSMAPDFLKDISGPPTPPAPSAN